MDGVSDPIYIKVERPVEGYEDVCDELVAEDFLDSKGAGFEWEVCKPDEVQW